MVMDYLKNRARSTTYEEESEQRPQWVSDRNASVKAWHCVEELKREKELYIRRHRNSSDYTVKRHYQIKGSEVAKRLGMNRAAIMNTSSYSADFRDYLCNPPNK